MSSSSSAADIELLKAHAVPLNGGRTDFEPLLKMIKTRDAEFVLLGEASHGTHDFYRVRAEITKRLIKEHGFTAVCVEADWPDAMRVNKWVKGSGLDTNATEALGGFKRFPQWMWRNADVLDFVGWLREHNEGARRAEQPLTGFYGMDLYSLHASIRSVLEYLKKTDPRAAKLASDRYACFDRFGDDTQRYGYLAGLGITDSCQRECVANLKQIVTNREAMLSRDGEKARDDYFDAEMNAKVVMDAEQYYRQMFREDVSSWNLRDSHMVDTLLALRAHLSAPPHGTAKIVVWAHNSHLGDASATSMGQRGEHNVGQLIRQKMGEKAVLVGFTTHSGTVTAATDWDEPAERRRVRDALPNSWELLFNDTALPSFFLDTSLPPLAPLLSKPRLERAIGVVYRPDTERQSHYFKAVLGKQFDAVFHYDVTRALEPMERTGTWVKGEVEETYPSGL